MKVFIIILALACTTLFAVDKKNNISELDKLSIVVAGLTCTSPADKRLLTKKIAEAKIAQQQKKEDVFLKKISEIKTEIAALKAAAKKEKLSQTNSGQVHYSFGLTWIGPYYTNMDESATYMLGLGFNVKYSKNNIGLEFGGNGILYKGNYFPQMAQIGGNIHLYGVAEVSPDFSLLLGPSIGLFKHPQKGVSPFYLITIDAGMDIHLAEHFSFGGGASAAVSSAAGSTVFLSAFLRALYKF